MGYHKDTIPKGKYGTSSKIMEEVLELIDSEKQDAKIMALNELADIIGAVRGYLVQNHPTMTLDDLIKMADLTKSAFEDGQRR
jgi:phosphoribosyl-ATP pyrophosphohydrolase